MTATETTDAGPVQRDLTAAAEHEITTADIGTIEPPAAIEAPRHTDEHVDRVMDDWHAGAEVEERRDRLPEPDRWSQMESMAVRLANAPTMPKHIRDSRDPVSDMMVLLLTAHDLGLNTTTALQKVNVIEGRPALSAEVMRMLIRRDGNDLWQEVERDPDTGKAIAVTWFGTRKDHPDRVHESRFSVEDAVSAGLCSRGQDGAIRARSSSSGKILPWESYTLAMLSARATSQLARMAFEDCLAGVSYTPEELGTISVEPLDAPPQIEPPMSDQHRQSLRDTIAKMSPEERALLGEKWKTRQVGSLNATEDRPGKVMIIRMSEMTTVIEIMAEARKEAIADAEIVPAGPPVHVFEGHDGSTECATCGHPRDHDLHIAPEPDESDSPEEGPETPPGGSVAAAPSDAPPGTGETPDAGDVGDGQAPSTLKVLEATQKVAKMGSRAVRDRLEAWRRPISQSEQADREALIAAMLERTMCDDCGKLQNGPGRADEARCPCPF